MVDPYLSDSVEAINPKNWRRVAVDESLFEEDIDMIVITHDHLDHLDPQTLERFLKKDKILTVLAPYNAWQQVRKNGKDHNYVMFNRGTEWTQNGIKFTAVRAEHSDDFAIGVIIDDGEKKNYITGDTLYNEQIFDDIPDDIHALFLPVNGVGNNMNMEDARRFSERVNPKLVVPIHCGMFDNIDMNRFECENKIVPKIYEEIEV